MVRRAWIALGLAVWGGLMFAVFYPVFASARAYSGPGMSARRVVRCAQIEHRESGKWPSEVTLNSPCLQRRPPREYALEVTLLGKPTDESAEYAVRLDQRQERWKVSANGVISRSKL